MKSWRLALCVFAVCAVACARIRVDIPDFSAFAGRARGEGKPKGPKAGKIKASHWHNTRRRIELKRLKGRFVIVHFFRVGNRASEREVTQLRDFASLHVGDTISVLGVHPQGGSAAVGDFLKSKGVRYPVAVDKEDETFRDYKLIGHPYAVLVGPGGRIAAEGSLSSVTAKAEELLREAP